MSFLRKLLLNVVSLFVFVLLIVIITAIAAGVFSSDELKKNAVLQVRLSGDIADRVGSEGFGFSEDEAGNIGFLAINKSIQAAIEDDRIKAIYLEIGEVTGGIANMASLRRSLQDFQGTGRKVFAYSDGISQLGYYLGSVADSIIVHPLAHVEWKGLSAQLMYFKSMLGKIGVEAEPIRAGSYKSAIEPFVLDEMSSANKHQIQSLLTDVWDQMSKEVCLSRKLDSINLNNLSNKLGYFLSSEAVSNRLIDGVLHEDEMTAVIQNATGLDFNLVSVSDYNDLNAAYDYAEQKIVVVNLEGEIKDGNDCSNVSSGRFCKLLDEILFDSQIKAVVVRINSPGGSALASEKIWRKVKLLSDKMPVIVSMGNVAASGGYYIASAADSILAEESTITGSIGVFGLMFNVQELSSTLGVNVEKVKTNELSDFPSFDRPLTDREKERLGQGIQFVYSTFLERVSVGRSLPLHSVEEIAEGRVWTGKKAKELGLVDEIGGVQEALKIAVKCAGVDTYQLIELPKELSPLEKITQHISSTEVRLPEPFSQYNYMIQNPSFFKDFSAPQVRLPFVLSFN